MLFWFTFTALVACGFIVLALAVETCCKPKRSLAAPKAPSGLRADLIVLEAEFIVAPVRALAEARIRLRAREGITLSVLENAQNFDWLIHRLGELSPDDAAPSAGPSGDRSTRVRFRKPST